MKSIKQLSFIGLVITLVLTSCSMEKRVYMSGYHIDWKNGKRNSNKQELVSSDNGKKKEQNQTVTVEQSETATNTVDNSFAPTVTEDNITASVDNQQIILPQKGKINLLSSHKLKTAEEEIKINPSIKSELKRGIKTISQNTDEEPKMSGMAIAGFICGILGLLLVLITGWPFLLGTLGTIFSAIGLGQTSKGKKGKGFAISGLITGILAIVIFWIWVAIIVFLLL